MTDPSSFDISCQDTVFVEISTFLGTEVSETLIFRSKMCLAEILFGPLSENTFFCNKDVLF
jgi:hypothetical protein